jgi:hypothetical protein
MSSLSTTAGLRQVEYLRRIEERRHTWREHESGVRVGVVTMSLIPSTIAVRAMLAYYRYFGRGKIYCL